MTIRNIPADDDDYNTSDNADYDDDNESILY